MSPRGPFWRKLFFAIFLIALGGIGLYLYMKYVIYAGPTLAWTRNGQDYELLAPRMLGIALLAPYFLWSSGDRSQIFRRSSVCSRRSSASRSSRFWRSDFRGSRVQRRRKKFAPCTSSTCRTRFRTPRSKMRAA